MARVEQDGPLLDASDGQVRAYPGIASESLTHRPLRLGVNDQQHTMFICERASQHHDALGDKGVHEHRVLGEAGLLTQRQRWVPLWAVTEFGYEEDRHLRTIASRWRVSHASRGAPARVAANSDVVGMARRNLM